jgi:hypothetical protein
MGVMLREKSYAPAAGKEGRGGELYKNKAITKGTTQKGKVEKPKVSGGAYKDISADGGQVHHMPAKSVSSFSENESPAIRMETRDHMQTASWGKRKTAMEYRNEQERLIKNGMFREAQQMDIDDIHQKFGNKYDDAIEQMLKYTDDLHK